MKVAVVGLGTEGKNAVKSLINYGYKVYASDMQKNMELDCNTAVDIDLGYHDFEKINSADAVVLSPSLWSSKIGEKIRSSKKFLSDILPDHKTVFTIGVTGTNGKTTTCFMIREILENAGFNVLVGGNAGGGFEGYTKLILESSKQKYDVLVVEVCDMTLDFCSYAFDFDLVVVTNMGQDHMDFHNSLENYKDSISKFIKEKTAILNEQDQILAQMGNYPSKTLFFGNGHRDLKLFGQYNLQNAAAAAKVAQFLEIPENNIDEALKNFEGVKGRSATLNISGCNFVVGKTDNSNATSAVLNELKFDVVMVGTPRGKEACRYDILKEVSEANPESVVLFPGLEDTTDIAFERLKKEGYNGDIKIIKDMPTILDFAIECSEKYQNIFIGGNGQNKLIEIQKALQRVSKDDIVIRNKKVLIIGAGNAGRPAAHLLNHLGNEVIISDIKEFEELPKKAKIKIKELMDKGVAVELGSHMNEHAMWADIVFISPSVPKKAAIREFIGECEENYEIDEINTKDIGRMINSLIKIPMIGIAGTDGKTTTTNMVNYTLSDKYDTLLFSSLQNSLVIEGLVDFVVENKMKSKDFAVFELPHGTIRMVDGLEICLGILTNLTPDHMDEFNSYEEYVKRNISIKDLLHKNGILIVNGDDPIISKLAPKFDQEVIYYGFDEPRDIVHDDMIYSHTLDVKYDILAEDIELKGLYGSEFTIKTGRIPTVICENCGKMCCNCDDFRRKYRESCTMRVKLKVPGMCNVENALAVFASDIILDFDLEDIKDKIESFQGVNGRFEKIDTVNEVNIFMDAAHNPEAMERLLEGMNVEGKLIITIDNPDTLTTRDKFKAGHALKKYVDVVIASAKNETTEQIDMDAALEVVEGAKGLETYTTKNIVDAIIKALEIADNGDTIIHIGPGVVNAYKQVKSDIIDGIIAYRKK
ncbi:Mur ligase family protein [Methanobacterium oryzae]|uniref:Mur ligase family protein n=1 Tax=Methanobacterium oryzae TaxID=69540 RepID=UPI003D1E1413